MKLVSAASVQEKTLNWLWNGLIPMGQTTLIEGDPGTAKSSLTIALAAHISRGLDWPDGEPCPQGHIILANAEDPEEEVIVPRLVAAGAELSKVHILVPDPDRPEDSFTIPDSVTQLEETITRWGVKLVIFDPLEAYISAGTDTYRNHHIRRALRTLEQMAKHLNCSVILVRHLNKSTDKAAIYRGGGSIGIIGAARAALSVGRDKADKDRCIVVPVKQNWTKIRGGIAYKPVEAKYVSANGIAITTSRIEWDGEVDVSADDIIMADVEPGEQGATEAAARFIRDQLESGPKLANELFSLARQSEISRKTMWRASKFLKVHKYKEGFGVGQQWYWSLTNEEEKRVLHSWATEGIEGLDIKAPLTN